MRHQTAEPLEHMVLWDDGPTPPPSQTVVLIHGFPDTHTVWTPTAAHLRRRGFRVVLVALPGFETDRQDTTPHRFDDVVERLYATLTTTGAVGATLVGHDWGAVFLYRLLARYPDAAGKLVTLEIGASAKSLVITLFVLFYHTLLIAAHTLGGPIGDRMMRIFSAFFPRPRYPEALRPNAHHGWLYRQAWREGANPGPWIGYFRNEIARWTPPASLPVLFIYGTSGLSALQFHTESWRQDVTSHNPESEAVGLAGNHWCFLESADAFQDALDRFLGEDDAG